MSDVFAELRRVREEARDARFRLAVITEATERRLDAVAVLDLVVPQMFLLADDGTPRNVKEILDRFQPLLVTVTEQKAAVAAAAAKPRLGEGPIRRAARMERAVARSRRVNGNLTA